MRPTRICTWADSNCSFNDIFYVIETANVFNFADDNTLIAFPNNIQNWKDLLEPESSLIVSKITRLRLI